MRRFATGRIVGLLIAIFGIGIAVRFADDASRKSAEFHDWVVARPMESAVDLSQAGETTMPFCQTCSISHGEALYLQCDTDDAGRSDPYELLKGLSGSLVVMDNDGNKIRSVKINCQTAALWDGNIMLERFPPFPNGDYVAAIIVDSGAPALRGKRQLLYAKYHLCGLEQMPAIVAGASAFGIGIIGLVAAVCVLPQLIRHGIWRHV